MIIVDVMTELGDALDTIEGLRVDRYPGEHPRPPCAMVQWPDSIDFDGSMARGMDRLEIEVDVIAGELVSRTGPALMSPYISGAGASSVKRALESFTYSACSSVRVESVRFVSTTIGDVQYITAIFTVDVVGPGS